MLRRLSCRLLLVLGLAGFVGLAPIVADSDARGDDTVPAVRIGADQTYTVVYKNIKVDGPWQIYGSYAHWADAARIRDFINSFPEYWAIVR